MAKRSSTVRFSDGRLTDRRRLLILVGLSACLLSSSLGRPEVASAGSRHWEWSDDDHEAIARLESRVAVRPSRGKPRLTVESKHWRVSTEVDARFTAELAHYMDLFHERFTALVKARVLVKLKPRVLVFKGPRAYAEIGGRGGGVFRARRDRDGRWSEFHLYTYVAHPRERHFPRFNQAMLHHEGCHAILRRYLGHRPPPWFDEGLATVFQAWKLRETVKENRERIPQRSLAASLLKLRAARAPLRPDLATLLGLPSEAWSPSDPKSSLRYARAESLVRLLLFDDRARSYLPRIFSRIRRQVEPGAVLDKSEQAALQAVWHGSLDQLTRRRP